MPGDLAAQRVQQSAAHQAMLAHDRMQNSGSAGGGGEDGIFATKLAGIPSIMPFVNLPDVFLSLRKLHLMSFVSLHNDYPSLTRYAGDSAISLKLKSS